MDLLTVCEWFDRTRSDTEITKPAWEQVEVAIRRLDNDRWNDVYLYPESSDPETYLCVGGGADRYLVSGSIGNEVFPTVIDPANSDTKEVPLVVGGQEGLYPANWIVDLTTALRACKAYYELGHLGGDITWINA